MHPVMPRHSSMSSLSLNRSIRSQQHGSHQPEGSESLSQTITLHITIIILTGPHISSLRLDHIGDHIVDQPVLVPDLLILEDLLVLFLVQFGEDVLESAVILLQDGVFCGEVEWEASLDGEFEAGMGEFRD